MKSVQRVDGVQQVLVQTHKRTLCVDVPSTYVTAKAVTQLLEVAHTTQQQQHTPQLMHPDTTRSRHAPFYA